MRRREIVLVALTVLLAGTWAMADDVFAPAWRGEDGTVTAGWDLWGPQGWGPHAIFLPEIQLIQANPGGFTDPFPATAYYDGRVNNQDLLWGRQGVLYVTAGDALGFSLANYDEDRAEKKVIVQITFRPGFGAPMNFDVGSSPVKEDPPWTLGEQRPAVVIDSYLAEDGWQTNSYGFSFWPNPEWESFMINFTEYPAYIDQVVVDTWCVPEPATLSLLALAGLAALRRRK